MQNKKGGDKFQFHMVRLKVTIYRKPVEYISFQFHMVRLKVRADDFSDDDQYYFNSTWYD